jgi:hypothetical protein
VCHKITGNVAEYRICRYQENYYFISEHFNLKVFSEENKVGSGGSYYGCLNNLDSNYDEGSSFDIWDNNS